MSRVGSSSGVARLTLLISIGLVLNKVDIWSAITGYSLVTAR